MNAYTATRVNMRSLTRAVMERYLFAAMAVASFVFEPSRMNGGAGEGRAQPPAWRALRCRGSAASGVSLCAVTPKVF